MAVQCHLLDIDEHHSWILKNSFNLAEEGHRLSAVNQSMVVRERHIHHWMNFHLHKNVICRTNTSLLWRLWAWHCLHLPLQRCCCRAPAAVNIYISFPQGAQQQTHHTPLLWSIDVMDKQTVHIRPLQRPCSRCYVDSLCKFSLTHWQYK